MTTTKYQRDRHLVDFHIAGFAYYDGLEVIKDLNLGNYVTLMPEVDNPYDSNAVAIYYQNNKIGYIPKYKNRLICQLLFYGHDLLEARIQYASYSNHPERQFRVVIMIKDNR